MTDSIRLTTALVASTLLHLLFALILALGFMRASATFQPPKYVDVDLAAIPPPAPKPAPAVKPQPAPAIAEPQPPPPPPIAIPKSQIVAPSESGEEKAPPKTNLLSDRDNTVPQPQVKRGEAPGQSDTEKRERQVDNIPEKPGGGKTGGIAKSAAVPPPEPRKPRERAASLPSLDQLFASPGDLASAGIAAAPEIKPTPNTQAKVERDLLGGSGVAFSSRPGISDYLPQIREGDITLLNTKAERFAPFVRRVAARVFQHLSIRLRQAANRGAVGSGRDVVVVEAIMNKQGRLVSARTVDRDIHTSLGADRELLNVTQPETFFDSNPPAGAEGNDGNIHFVLLLDLQVQSSIDPRTNRAGTGYYGVAGVGLDAVPRRN